MIQSVNKAELQWIAYVFLANAVVVLFYFIWRMLRKDYKKAWMMSLFMLAAPVVGPLYLMASSLLYAIYFKRRKAIIDIETLSFRKDTIAETVKEDIQSALNKVPIEEALLVSDVQHTRRLLLNVLKNDTGQYIHSINQAIYNEDSEVAHYAAAAMTDIMNQFKNKEKKLRNAYEADPTNAEIGEIYWLHISEFLKTEVLPQLEQERYLRVLDHLTKELEENHSDLVTSEMYHLLTKMEIDQGKIDQAKIWAEHALETRPDDLASYKAGLKYYYESEQYDLYKQLLKTLMDSTIRLDQEMLELVRFYTQ